MRIAALAAVLAAPGACGPTQECLVREASGILVEENSWYLVGDSTPGVVLKLPLESLPEVGSGVHTIGPIVRAERLELRGNRQGREDLEDLALLGGRLVMLSESGSRVSTLEHQVIRYDELDWVRASGEKNDGLEGLAVRPVDTCTSEVAVLLERLRGGDSAGPALGVHRMLHEPRGALLKLRELEALPIDTAELRRSAGLDEGDVLQGRALVWYRWPAGSGPLPNADRWGFIVLLAERGGAQRRWLLRTDARGRVPGGAENAFVRLAELLGEADEAHGWEGLAWREGAASVGESLVLVEDNGASGSKAATTPTRVVVVALPEEWR